MSTTKMSTTKVVKDSSLMVLPYFKVDASQKEAFNTSCESYYKTCTETEDMVSYGVSHSEGGAHMRQGYRNAAAAVATMQTMQSSMTETLKTSSLEKVEVHGTRKEIMKVKKSMTKVEQTNIQFFETHKKMHSVAKNTTFNGAMGSEKLVSITVTIQVSTVTEMRTLEPKVKPIHRRAIDCKGNHSFSFSRCADAGMAKIVATFDSMEDAMEHMACMVAHLGSEALHFLEMHGPDWMLSQIKGLMSKTGEAIGDAAKVVEKALAAAAKKASEDALMAKACAEAAAKACEQKASEVLTAARDKAAEGVKAVQQKAKDMAKKIYDEAMKAEGATEAAAKAVAKAAYKNAMDAANDIRQAADDAAKVAYDEALAAGKAVDAAIKAAHDAAKAAAKAAHDEMKELAEDAQAAYEKAKETGAEAVAAAHAELLAAKLSMQIGALEVERLMSAAVEAVRKAMFNLYDAVRKDAVAVCEATYKGAVAAKEVTEEIVQVGCDKAKAAAFAVCSAADHVYNDAYHKALEAGKALNDCKDAAVKAAEYASSKALDTWKLGEQLCSDALSSATNMAKQGVQALSHALSNAVAFVLEGAKAIRKTLLKATAAAKDMVYSGMLDFAWAVGHVVEAAGDALEGAAGVIGDAVGALKQHFDHAITMIPHFTFGEEHREKFKQQVVSFQQTSTKTTDTLFYGVCHKEGGACIRQGYRNASSMVSYLRESQTTMTEVTKFSTLQKVEVHGTRRQLVKVRKQVTKVTNVTIEFYEVDKKLKSVRRAQEFSGSNGSDQMVSAHVSMKVTKQEEKVVRHKLKAVHEAARDHPHVHQLSISKALKTGELKIMGTFASMEAGLEHLSTAAMHLGSDILSTLEMHGPQQELDKVKGLVGSMAGAAAGAAASCMGCLKGALSAAEKKAADTLMEAKALVQAAEKAVMAAVTSEAESARDKVASTIEGLQSTAEEMAQNIYKDAMKAEKFAAHEVKELAKEAYKASMNAYTEIRQAADEAARKAYERAMAAGASAEQALEDAHKAADAAASAMKEEMVDAAEAAQAEVDGAEAATAAAAKKALETAAATAHAAADFATKAVEAVASATSKEARGLLLAMHGSLKTSTTEVVAVHYKKEVHTEEKIRVVGDRARAAAWSVTVTREETYYVTYEKVIIQRKGPEEALKAAKEAAEGAAKKVLDTWRKSESYAADAVNAAKDMVSKEEKALVDTWNKGVSYALDMETSIRHSLYSGVALADEEVNEACEDVAWAVGTVVDEVAETFDDAHKELSDRIKSWYDALIAAEVKGLRAVADAADARADTVERKQKVCC